MLLEYVLSRSCAVVLVRTLGCYSGGLVLLSEGSECCWDCCYGW